MDTGQMHSPFLHALVMMYVVCIGTFTFVSPSHTHTSTSTCDAQTTLVSELVKIGGGVACSPGAASGWNIQDVELEAQKDARRSTFPAWDHY
jgi:hypothetical protein